MGLMLGASSLYAQPGSVQKLAKSVFTLTTFNQKGDIIASTQGVFIDNKGTAISTFKPFVGAVKASVVDASGKSIPVEAIMGSRRTLRCGKIRINASTVAAPIATKESAAGDKVWLVPYSIKSRLTSRRTSAAWRNSRLRTTITSSRIVLPKMQ